MAKAAARTVVGAALVAELLAVAGDPADPAVAVETAVIAGTVPAGATVVPEATALVEAQVVPEATVVTVARVVRGEMAVSAVPVVRGATVGTAVLVVLDATAGPADRAIEVSKVPAAPGRIVRGMSGRAIVRGVSGETLPEAGDRTDRRASAPGTVRGATGLSDLGGEGRKALGHVERVALSVPMTDAAAAMMTVGTAEAMSGGAAATMTVGTAGMTIDGAAATMTVGSAGTTMMVVTGAGTTGIVGASRRRNRVPGRQPGPMSPRCRASSMGRPCRSR